MSKKVKVSPNLKEFLVLKFKELNISLSQFCRIYNVERTAIIRWSIKYELGGKEALFEITTRTTYSAYTLINSVKDYLSGNFSMLDIVKKYNLSGDSVLRNWLKWYNTPKWNVKVEEFMAREKISKSFKLSLVLQVLQQNLAVKEVASSNSISEGQLRDWIRKYKAFGEEALEDNRGNKKSAEFLSTEEILKRKNKELEEKNRRLEAELLLLKKLMELEGGVI